MLIHEEPTNVSEIRGNQHYNQRTDVAWDTRELLEVRATATEQEKRLCKEHTNKSLELARIVEVITCANCDSNTPPPPQHHPFIPPPPPTHTRLASIFNQISIIRRVIIRQITIILSLSICIISLFYNLYFYLWANSLKLTILLAVHF